jgi:UDP-N-acetylmuramate--alanine ligase
MGSIFEAYHAGDYLGKITLSVPGRHNAWNALAAMAVALELGYPFATVAASLTNFHGAKRRFQVMGNIGSSTVVDDYAHHPTEIKATIKAARDLDYERVLVIFQPHRYSRTKLLADQFASAFQEADLVIISDIYSAGEKPIDGISSELIYRLALQAGANVVYIPSLEEIESFIQQEMKDNDLVITMGAGDIWRLGVKLVEKNAATIAHA